MSEATKDETSAAYRTGLADERRAVIKYLREAAAKLRECGLEQMVGTLMASADDIERRKHWE